ncbi:hypothetical protein ADZ36_28645 [Streptomyces fradiae]|uniref:Uncharacterized protein n=1 Tax=Streptomyces fradiae TaxID=1906 RepID=A0ACC4W3N8_STRFR|nr:hypothetical protein ADZ36_28645 [Streptomyces fradiae]OFA36380.1 hypothetical protein BEN35_30115 [Streptomyces fradiae]
MSGTADVRELWLRFEGWLRQHAPGDCAALHPGAGEAEIAGLEREIGFPLHGELKALLALRNGVTPRESSMEPGAFLLGYSLLDTAGIPEWQRKFASMAEKAAEDGYEEEVVGRIAHGRWVPFAQGITGDLLFVDHRESHFGEVGEMFFGSPEYRLLWPGMAQMLRDMCAAVEDMTELSVAGVRPAVHQERMLEWPAV